VLSFDAAIAFENTISPALGGMVTGLVSRSNLSGIIVVTPLRPRSKARRATWSPSSVVKNMTRASACCSTCARRTKLARPRYKHTAERTNARPSLRPTHSSGKPAASTPSSTRTASRSSLTALPNQTTNVTFARHSIRPAFIGAGTTPIDGTVISVIGHCWPRLMGTPGRSRSGRNSCRPARRGRCKSEHSCVRNRILRSRSRRSCAVVTSRPFLLRQLFLFLTLPLWSHGYIYL